MLPFIFHVAIYAIIFFIKNFALFICSPDLHCYTSLKISLN